MKAGHKIKKFDVIHGKLLAVVIDAFGDRQYCHAGVIDVIHREWVFYISSKKLPLFSTRLPLLHMQRDRLYGYGPAFDLDLACGRATSIPTLVTLPAFPLLKLVKPAPTAEDAVKISRNSLRRRSCTR